MSMSREVRDGVLYLDLSLTESSQSLDIFPSESSQSLEIEMMGGSEGRYPYYLGPYIVDPRKVSQTLATKNKSMSDDVTINEIFYSEVPNSAGGETAYIGLE